MREARYAGSSAAASETRRTPVTAAAISGASVPSTLNSSATARRPFFLSLLGAKRRWGNRVWPCRSDDGPGGVLQACWRITRSAGANLMEVGHEALRWSGCVAARDLDLHR